MTQSLHSQLASAQKQVEIQQRQSHIKQLQKQLSKARYQDKHLAFELELAQDELAALL